MRLIFDTDMGNDVDDAMALAMIHALQSRGRCKLLAVTLTKDNEYAVRLLCKVLTGQPDGSVVIAQVGFSTNLAGLRGWQVPISIGST